MLAAGIAPPWRRDGGDGPSSPAKPQECGQASAGEVPTPFSLVLPLQGQEEDAQEGALSGEAPS